MLVESARPEGTVEGRAAHQAPEVDGSTLVRGGLTSGVAPGLLVKAVVVGSEGADLVAEAGS